MADIVEIYNRTEKENPVIFQYREDPVSSFFNENKRPDIVINTNLTNNIFKNEMADLSFILDSDESLDSLAKSPLLVTGEDGKIPLLPLSYSPLVIVYKRNNKRIAANKTVLNIEEIEEKSTAFNEEKRIGYSPYWDDSFLMALMDLYGSSFQSDEKTLLKWNDEGLDLSLKRLDHWEEQNGGMESMNDFNNKYMYENRIKLLLDERILFSTFPLGKFLCYSDSRINDLDFALLAHAGNIHPGDTINGGINRKTKSFRGSSRFLKWLLQEESQKEIVASAIKNNIGSFGFLGGLSTLDKINREIITRYYPRIAGKIPSTDYLLEQPEKPVEYNKVKEELLTAWLHKRREGSTLPLSEALDKWEKLRIPF